MIKADLHCHTIASAHAYSTVFEFISFAKLKKLEMIAITDHGPLMPDAPHISHFKNLRSLPRVYDGVKILRGVEANIKDFEGALDVPKEILQTLDWVIASFHKETYKRGSAAGNTAAWIQAAKNPLIDLIGHCDRLPYLFEHERAIGAFKEYDKIVEINNHSFNMKKWDKAILSDIIRICKKYDVYVIASSDAHICFDIGNTQNAIEILDEFSYKKDLILNYDVDALIERIEKKRGKIFV